MGACMHTYIHAYNPHLQKLTKHVIAVYLCRPDSLPPVECFKSIFDVRLPGIHRAEHYQGKEGW